MRLHGIHDGRLYATDYREVWFERGDARFETVGRLPGPRAVPGGTGYRVRASRWWKPAIESVVGAFPTTTLHRLTDSDLLATVGPLVFTSHDAGRHWQLRRRLPPSSGPMGVLPTGVCYHDGTLLLGEYPLAEEAVPRVLRSDDSGRTWTTALTLEGVRHIHAVQVDPYTGDYWITTGDADEACSIGRLRDGELEVVGGGSQHWRTVELAFTPSAVLWGVDCVYAPTNPIYKLDRDDLARGRAAPTRVYEASDSVFYAATLPVGDDRWVVFSTAAEAAQDSTAPTAANAGTGTVSVIASASSTGFAEWFELARYARRPCPADRINPGGRVPVASAYAFVAADPQRGLFVNPYNTAADGGSIVRYPVDDFEQLGS